MATEIRHIQEPVRPQFPPRVGSTPVPGSDEASGAPRGCTKCGSGALKPKFHRDLIACLLDEPRGKACGGEHLHWRCANCDADFTTPCLTGTHIE